MSKWVVLCPECDQEFRIEAEEIPEKCPRCGFDRDFEVIDEDGDECG